jgi:hypothetical protein
MYVKNQKKIRYGFWFTVGPKFAIFYTSPQVPEPVVIGLNWWLGHSITFIVGDKFKNQKVFIFIYSGHIALNNIGGLVSQTQ